MRYLFLAGHPAHVHLFRHVIRSIRDEGHAVIVGAIPREVTIDLLQAYGIPHFIFGKSRSSLVAKALDVVPKDLILLHQARLFNPDVFVSTGSPYGAHASAVLARPHLVFGDTENATLTTRITLPFTDCVCTPVAFHQDLGSKHIRYNGYKELAYLHPKYFQPDSSVLEEVGLQPSERFAIVRFASRDASHDLHERGFRFGNGAALAFLERLGKYARVVVTSDGPLGPDLAQYGLQVRPERIHDLLAFAQIYIGEGATMAAEAGVLGVPWLFVSSARRGFLDEQQQRYGLGLRTNSAAASLDRAIEWLSRPDLRRVWRQKRDLMLHEKEDVTKFMLEFIRGWPESFLAAKQSNRSRYEVAKTTG